MRSPPPGCPWSSSIQGRCAISPERNEVEIAARLRAASPTAYPNRRLVALADRYLKRGGKMTAAIETMGFGIGAYEAEPFGLDLR